MSATLLTFEAGMITGSVIASLTWLWLTRRHQRRARGPFVELSRDNVQQQVARLLDVERGQGTSLGSVPPSRTDAPAPPDPYRPLPQHHPRRRW